MSKFIDLTGQRFGFWVVLNRQETNKKGQTQWLCQCECGNKKLVTANSLRTGNSTSCGCNHKPDLTNQKFNNLTVIEKSHSKGRRYWSCRCECGNFIICTTKELRDNETKSCGCHFKEKINVIPTAAHVSTSQYIDLSNNIGVLQEYLNNLRKNTHDAIHFERKARESLNNLQNTFHKLKKLKTS